MNELISTMCCEDNIFNALACKRCIIPPNMGLDCPLMAIAITHLSTCPKGLYIMTTVYKLTLSPGKGYLMNIFNLNILQISVTMVDLTIKGVEGFTGSLFPSPQQQIETCRSHFKTYVGLTKPDQIFMWIEDFDDLFEFATTFEVLDRREQVYVDIMVDKLSTLRHLPPTKENLQHLCIFAISQARHDQPILEKREKSAVNMAFLVCFHLAVQIYSGREHDYISYHHQDYILIVKIVNVKLAMIIYH